MTPLPEGTIQIVFFSGTGGTARAAACLAESFSALGREVSVRSLDAPLDAGPASQGDENPAAGIVLLFPVHAFGAPLPVHEWISGLPQGGGTPTAVLSVSGGGEFWPNSDSRVVCIRRLERRGYPVFYERMLVMPANLFTPTPPVLAGRLLAVLPAKTDHCAMEIQAGIRRRRRRFGIAAVARLVSPMERRGARWFGRTMRADDRCNGCGLCASACPRSNIRMAGDRPDFGSACVLCMRCIYGCPTGSIRPRHFRKVLLNGGFSLDRIDRERTNGGAGTEPDPKAGILFAGIQDYLDRIEG